MNRLLPIALLALILPGMADDVAIRFLEDRVKGDSDDFIAWNKLAARYHDALRRTGEERFIALEQSAAEASLKAMGAEQNTGGLAALAQARLTAHRFGEARDAAAQLRDLLPGKPRPLELLTDALLELGDYDDAQKACAELAAIDGAQLSAAPRLAKLDLIHGSNDSARAHLARGLALSTTPELSAWFQLQLGELAFKSGDWIAAEKHYTAAGDGWAATDHLAELRAAQGRTGEAIAIYEKLAASNPRPEFLQALGDIHILAGSPDKAAPWFARAAEAYLRSTGTGAVHYFHHLAGFYADSQEDPAKAVEWARKDFALRHSIHAWDTLAWALYKNGQPAEAADAIAKALATGTRDSHLLYHAALIRTAAGDFAGGKKALQQAAAANPRFNTFHVHR